MKAEYLFDFLENGKNFWIENKNFSKFQKCSLLDLKNKLAKI